MIADILMWLEDNLIITGGGLGFLLLVGFIVRSSRRQKDAPIQTSADFETPDAVSSLTAADTPSHLPPVEFAVLTSEDLQPVPSAQEDEHLAREAQEPTPTYYPAQNHEDARHLIQSIQGDPPRRSFSVFYMAALVIVAVIMLILPLIYLAIVAGVGYGTVWYAMEKRTLLETITSARGKVIAYGGPILIGATLFLFLLKPLFARRPRGMNPVALTEAEQPVLFAFVRELCHTLKAPAPRRIDVICDANASASFRSGLWSLLRPGDLVLTIGLPLAAGMNLQNFTGVLAHEFGHFTQGLAMRLLYIISYINMWFARLVYGNDTWDRALNEMISSSPGFVGIIFLVAKGAVWISRGILWVLMMIGQAVSCFLMRQQEYDADRYQAYIAGSSQFADTYANIIDLSVAMSGAYKDVNIGLEKMALPEDFMGLCMHNYRAIPQELLQHVRIQEYQSKMGLLDTHPTAARRVRATDQLAFPGIFHPPDVPASVLFRNLEDLNQRATLNLYQSALGRLVDKRITVPLAKFLEKIEIMNKGVRKKW